MFRCIESSQSPDSPFELSLRSMRNVTWHEESSQKIKNMYLDSTIPHKTGSFDATGKKKFLPAQRCKRDTRRPIFARNSAARAHSRLLVTVNWSHISLVYPTCGTQLRIATIAVGQ